MNLNDLVDALSNEHGMDLSSDSQDGWRGIFFYDGDRKIPVRELRVDSDGDIVLEA